MRIWRPILTLSLYGCFFYQYPFFRIYGIQVDNCVTNWIKTLKAWYLFFLIKPWLFIFLFWQRSFQKWPRLWRRRSVCCVGWWRTLQTTRAKLATWKQPGASGATSCCSWVPLLTINFHPSPWKFLRAATTYGPKQKRPSNTFTKTTTMMPTGSWKQMTIHMLL